MTGSDALAVPSHDVVCGLPLVEHALYLNPEVA